MKGTHKGKFGWVNKEKGETKKQIYVIVEEADKEVLTRVNKASIQVVPTTEEEPDSFEEAILQQVPKINELMTNLAVELAKVKGVSYRRSHGKLCELFGEKLLAAELMQSTLGRDATWRFVEYDEDFDDGTLSVSESAVSMLSGILNRD